MTLLYKVALGPILLHQGKRLRGTALRLPEPEGLRSGVVNGHNENTIPLRILFVGDSSAAGVGVPHQEQALASQTAKFLAEKTGRAVTWQLVAKSGVNTLEALSMLDEHEIKPADVLVTALGVNDVTSQRTPGQFLADYKALVQRSRELAGARFVVINGLPPMHVLPAVPQPLRWYLGQCAKRMDAALMKWTASDVQMSYLSLQWAAKPHEMARDGFHPGLGQYQRWAEVVAERAIGLLNPCASNVDHVHP